MFVMIRTLNAQRRLKVDTPEEIDGKIRGLFKTEEYKLYSDADKTIQIEPQNIKDGATVYMEYNIGEIKEYEETRKCTHSSNAVCPKCVDLGETEKAIEEHKKAKYLSYEGYKEMLEQRGTKEEIFDYEIKVCDDHPANQKCSKCMEKKITLLGQPYRHVDYVEFDSKDMVENFIDGFKATGRQKIGLLIGKYAPYTEAYLGQKAVVSGIWEVEQECFPDGVVLNSIPDSFFIDELKIVGVIYTDLIFKDKELSSWKRLEGYLFSTVEIAFINGLREKTGNRAFFGVCLAVNDEKEISSEVLMVTDQYAALSKANAISLTTDPEQFKANRDIAYRVIDEYGNRIPKDADPFLPVFYFIVNCETGVKKNPLFEHNTRLKKPTLKNISGYFGSDFRIDQFRCFNVLMALERFLPNSIEKLIEAAMKNDQILLNSAMRSDEFQEFKKELEKYNLKAWNCSACTYLNQASVSTCDICGTSKE